jgi:dTDP-4-amino-4,6-dideoxygalactose transaminase
MNAVRVPFTELQLSEDAEAVHAAIERVLDRAWLVLGPECEAFEREFAAASGSAHAIGTGNGTDAIALALRALGVGPGDEVVTSALSAAFTALAIVMAGATPVFADIDPARMTLDPGAAERAITPRTRAIVPVHLYGQPADMTAFAALADKYTLALVEDCCQAHLATCDGRAVGTFGAAGAFSFYPTKNLGALGDGGAVITGDPDVADRVRRLRNGGQTERYQHVDLGVNSRLDELQAAVLRARLPLLAARTAERRGLAAEYRRRLAGTSVTVPIEIDPGHVYHLFPVRTTSRAALQAHMQAAGIQTLVHYPVAVCDQPAFAPATSDCPEARRAASEVVSLPLYPGMPAGHLAAVTDHIHSFAEAGRHSGKEKAS